MFILKILWFLFKVCVVIFLIGWALILKDRAKAKKTAASQMDSDPQAAVDALKKCFLSDSLPVKEYVKELEKIVDRTGYAGAMGELAQIYENGHKGEMKDASKCQYWKDRMVKAGDIKSIIEHYGITEYDIASEQYEEITRDLATARRAASTDNQQILLDYFNGLLYFKTGNTEAARNIFSAISSPQLAVQSKYMELKCFLREGNLQAAEKILETLEGGDSMLTADDYLALYNAYAGKKDGNKTDFETAARYADQYAASEGADSETANQIRGDLSCAIAVNMKNGTNGFPKDPERALEAYKKAAQYENAEAMYYLGEGYWSGRLIRNYDVANFYLSKAAEKGQKEAQEILQQYGVEGVLVRRERTGPRTYRFLDGYEVTASENLLDWLQLWHGIYYKGILIKHAFGKRYSSRFYSFDKMINGVHQLYADHVAEMIKWCLTLLMSFGIDSYDGSDILEACDDLGLLSRVPRFEQGLEQIDARADALHIQLDYARATRRVWKGAGFGTTISGAVASTVKASVAAGAMNIGSGILHGIGDSIVKAMNNSEIKGMEKKLFESPDTKKEFVNAIRSACDEVGQVVVNFIVKHSSINPDALRGEIQFEGENLANLNDKALKAKINNNLTAGNYKYGYALLVEHLRRFPFDDETLEQIIALTVQREDPLPANVYDSITRYAGDFQLDVSDILKPASGNG